MRRRMTTFHAPRSARPGAPRATRREKSRATSGDGHARVHTAKGDGGGKPARGEERAKAKRRTREERRRIRGRCGGHRSGRFRLPPAHRPRPRPKGGSQHKKGSEQRKRDGTRAETPGNSAMRQLPLGEADSADGPLRVGPTRRPHEPTPDERAIGRPDIRATPRPAPHPAGRNARVSAYRSGRTRARQGMRKGARTEPGGLRAHDGAAAGGRPVGPAQRPLGMRGPGGVRI